MGVIGKKGPGIAGGLCFRKRRGQASDEVVSIPVIPEDIFSLDPPLIITLRSAPEISRRA
jgi:hypothetical protein